MTRGDAVLDEDGFLSLGVQAGEVEVVAAYEENGIFVEGRMSVTVHPTVLPQNALGEFETWLSVHGIALDRQAARRKPAWGIFGKCEPQNDAKLPNDKLLNYLTEECQIT